ncbi:Zinc-finger homeodomain protein 11 [Zea mays]|uniref:Zinc-finger homeodomain protein 11 n=1 Tax=Zea mays TaxID=4577 RepID=A0A3L6EPZ0_MAIZE|nr:Zinc-finger homeodomain protein 11 [Zea mays]
MDQQQHQERPWEVYRECMRNHAAKLGTYASDGCCEYTPDDGQPAAMLCAACGCHRNFHRKAFLADAAAGAHGGGGAHGAMLPSPGASPGYGMHHMAIATAGMGGDAGAHGSGSGGRRRTRTKFTDEQKERMARLAERLGWRMPKREPGRALGDDEVGRFCREIGVTRQVFKQRGGNPCPTSAVADLKVCADVLVLLKLRINVPQGQQCCPLLGGLVDLDLAACLCAAIRLNALGVPVNLPLDVPLVLNYCGRNASAVPGSNCPF